MDSIQAQLSYLREKLGFTQNEFSQAFGFSNPSTLTDIESGLAYPNRTVAMMANLLSELAESEARSLILKLIEQNKKF